MRSCLLAGCCQKLIKLFSSVQFDHVPRLYNKHADTLATLASKVDVRQTVGVKVIRRTLRAKATDFIPLNLSMGRTSTHNSESPPTILHSDSKELKEFTFVDGVLFLRDSGGILA